MPEFLALGSTNRTGDLVFGPTPSGPATWVPPESPLMTLPSSDDDLEALLIAAEAKIEAKATRIISNVFRARAPMSAALVPRRG